MIEDMTIRKFASRTQEGYIRAIKGFSVFPRAVAGHGELRGFAPLSAASGRKRRRRAERSTIAVTALRFLFTVTLRKPASCSICPSCGSRGRLPVVLSPEEVARLLDAAPSLKYKAALSVAYGAGLRASEVDLAQGLRHRQCAHGHTGRARQGPQGPLCHAVASICSDLLRAWWKAARPQGWLFPGAEPGQPSHDAPAQPRLPCRGANGRDRQAGVPAHAAA